jgi:RecA/RadA recombinase
LRKISLTPASGYIAYDRATTTKTTTGTSSIKISTTTEMVIRYTEKSTTKLFETNQNTTNVLRMSNTTLGVFDQVTFSNPQSFVGQHFNESSSLIDTYIGSFIKIGTSTPELRTTGTYFPRNPETVAVKGTSLFSLYSYPLSAEGYITQTTPVKEVKVFSSRLSEWNVEWINKNLLMFTTKPNSGYDGFVYTYNPITKKQTEILAKKPGLTAKVNSTVTAAVYSESFNNKLNFFITNLTKNLSFQTSSPTLPEKCVFSAKSPMIVYCAVPRPLPIGSYPEDWYKGKVQFSDALVRFDIEKNVELPIVNFEQEGGEAIDAINLSINEKETFVTFQNKRDGYVWSYDLR